MSTPRSRQPACRVLFLRARSSSSTRWHSYVRQLKSASLLKARFHLVIGMRALTSRRRGGVRVPRRWSSTATSSARTPRRRSKVRDTWVHSHPGATVRCREAPTPEMIRCRRRSTRPPLPPAAADRREPVPRARRRVRGRSRRTNGTSVRSASGKRRMESALRPPPCCGSTGRCTVCPRWAEAPTSGDG